VSSTGYTTDFTGQVTITPPLNEHEASYLADFAYSRRMEREEGPYYAKNDGNFGQTSTPGVRNYNGPPAGQPGLWCQWIPGQSYATGEDNAALEWDGGEKFYNAAEWMAYLIDHFLKPACAAACNLSDAIKQDERFAHFTFDHVLNGEIFAIGEDPDDRWKIVVENNVVKTANAVITYTTPS
jgi:hypothetical protein